MKIFAAGVFTFLVAIFHVIGILLGLLLVPLGYKLGLTIRGGKFSRKPYIWGFKSKWLWLWGNDEDGVDGRPHVISESVWLETPSFKTVFAWSALRNPFNNARFWKPVIPNPSKYQVLWNNPSRGWLIRQGLLLGFQVRAFGWRLWLGIKFKPSDLDGPLPDWDTRSAGAGFALQLKKVPV
jgi:hypothetical protein